VSVLLDDAGCLTLSCDGRRWSLTSGLVERRWYHVGVSIGDGRVALAAEPLHPTVVDAVTARVETREFDADFGGAPAGAACLAARVDGSASFNGKLEAPTLFAGAVQAGHLARKLDLSMIAAWDFTQDISGVRIIDVSGNNYHGETVNLPTRAVKGWRWDGSVQRWTDRPEHYGAIHFHDTDLADAGWEADLEWTIPDDLPSGVYAFRLNHAGTDDYVPFFVTPATHHTRNKVAFLASTATYLAYANQRLFLMGGIFGDPTPKEANMAFLERHPEVGYSLYEHHDDRSGVHFSSRLRPILNLKPKGQMWSFNADTNILAWLEHIATPFDVITDEILHRDGVKALAPYSVVITGTHPEYYSTEMLDGVDDYLRRGGRAMYMGGNGFYWRIAYRGDEIIEVRRAEDGTRAWMSEPGEYYHALNGEYGGMWRRQGRPPNHLVGIGFAAQGFDGSSYYRRTPASFESRAAFIFDGVVADDIVGDYGSIGDGAAGEEIDRHDASLGSPAHALILASSEKHKPGMLRVKEEFLATLPPFDDPKVRADMVFFETPKGGAVFSTGSIAYAGALAHDEYDNDICRITGNVLRRMLDPEPFLLPD
jgi:N,N-dimethylformamidase